MKVFARSWNCGSRVEVISSVSAVLEEGVPVEEMEAEDVGLDAIFRYLVK